MTLNEKNFIEACAKISTHNGSRPQKQTEYKEEAKKLQNQNVTIIGQYILIYAG